MTTTLDRARRVKELRADVRQRRVADWMHDPAKWVDDCVLFHEGEQLAGYQRDELTRLGENRRVAVRAPRGAGKTMPAGLAFWWFACTRELAGVDWKIPTTAGAWRQVSKFLWPEIHKWGRRIRWDIVGLPAPRLNVELLKLELNWRHGSGFGVAASDPALIEGAHASSIMVIVDESKSVSDDIFDAIEGFFSNPGDHYVFALSTPGAAVGRFHDICTQRPGYEDWHPIHVTIGEAVAAGRIQQEWVDQRLKQWGRDSQAYRCHVLAEFAGEEDGVIPMAWIEAAMERQCDHDRHLPEVIGADIATTGEDNTYLASRFGNEIYALEKFTEGDTMHHADLILARAQTGTVPIVDAIGVGAGTFDQVKKTYPGAVGFVASQRTKRKDASGVFGFINKRAAAWWNLREMLDPDVDDPVVLPNDPELLGDLSAPKWREAAGGKIQIESKDDIRKRIGRSTDAGDAVVMAFWSERNVSRRVWREGALDGVLKT